MGGRDGQVVEPGGVTMRLVEAGRFGRAELPVPRPGPGEVVVEMRALGICGTDVHMFGGRGDTYPHVVGHDGAAVVHEAGAGVDTLVAGQRVTIDPTTSCGDCEACRGRRGHLCAAAGYLGMIGPGLLAQYVRLPAGQAVPLPETVSDLAASVLEPVAVALHLLERVTPLLPAPAACGVVGGGPLGILLAQVLRGRGYLPHVFEPYARRRALAADLGLDVHPPEVVALGRGPRLIVETSAAASGVALADDLCTPGSVVAVVGRAPESIRPASLLLKELTVVGVKGGPNMYPRAIALAADGSIDPAVVITHEFGWYEAQAAFTATAERPDEVLRSVLRGPW